MDNQTRKANMADLRKRVRRLEKTLNTVRNNTHDYHVQDASIRGIEALNLSWEETKEASRSDPETAWEVLNLFHKRLYITEQRLETLLDQDRPDDSPHPDDDDDSSAMLPSGLALLL